MSPIEIALAIATIVSGVAAAIYIGRVLGLFRGKKGRT